MPEVVTEGVTEETPPVSTAEPSLPTDRPAQNIVAEFNRKLGRLENTVNTLAQAVTMQQNQPTRAPAQGVTSEDDLFKMAQEGNKDAFKEWTRRQSAETIAQYDTHTRAQNMVNGQLVALGNKYPVLNDASHPLTQTAQTAYQLLLAQGYAPGKATYRDAIFNAIAERDDLVAEMKSKGNVVRENARQSAASNATNGAMGASHRSDEPSQNAKIRVTPEQSALAKRMGVADPAKAIENMRKRRESGQSSFGAVGLHIPEGEI